MTEGLLDEDSRHGLRQLAEFLFGLRGWAGSGKTLIGLGEVVTTLEELADEGTADIDIIVRLSIGGREGDGDTEEGLYADLEFSDEGLSFGELRTSYTKGNGSDHCSLNHGRFDSLNGFDWAATARWRQLVQKMVVEYRPSLTAYRDHV